MLHLQRSKTARKAASLSDVFEAFVEADRPMKRSIGFGVFDASGTMVDRLLARLPKAAVLLAPTATQVPAATPVPTSVEPYGPGSASP